MCVMVRDKVKNGMYEFLAKTFRWPSVRTVSEYDSVGGLNPDGAMYDVIEQAELETKGLDEWKRMVSLKHDAMHIGSRIKCNPHTMEVVGFANDSFDFNVLAKEYDALNGTDEDEEEQKLEHAKLYLVSMISNWEKNMKQITRVVARYSLGSGISSNFLDGEI